jgi:hypothetical protein
VPQDSSAPVAAEFIGILLAQDFNGVASIGSNVNHQIIATRTVYSRLHSFRFFPWRQLRYFIDSYIDRFPSGSAFRLLVSHYSGYRGE